MGRACNQNRLESERNLHLVAFFDQLDMVASIRVRAGSPESELDWVSTEVGFEFSGNVDMWWFSGCVLHNQKQFGHDFDDVTCLKDKVALFLDALG